METIGFTMGVTGFVFALIALQRIANLEKKLKQFDVIPRDFDSGKDSGKD
jgi:hypothetical protein